MPNSKITSSYIASAISSAVMLFKGTRLTQLFHISVMSRMHLKGFDK